MNSFGFYLIFGYLYFDCKVESETAINKIKKGDEKELTLFIIDAQAKPARVNDKEIIINNRHYDIVKREMKSNQIYLYCLCDVREDIVSHEFYSFNKIYDNNPGQSKSKSDFLPDKLIKNFLSPALINFNCYRLTYRFNNIDDQSYAIPFRKILSPPPEQPLI